ncbi:MAG: DUF3422 family protein [Candidatus Puniceispirillaceae bacterium]
MMRFEEHPQRRRLNDELHARKFNDFDGTGRFIRYVYFTQGDDARLLADVNDMLQSLSLPVMKDDEKFIRFQTDTYAIRVERHTEFMSLSIIDNDDAPVRGLPLHGFDEASFAHLPFTKIRALPHPVFHAMWLEICDLPQILPNAAEMEKLLSGRSVAGSKISAGGAHLYAGFDIDEAGYSRMALLNDSVASHRMGRVIQRVIELETYRLMALLGLPKVKFLSPDLVQAEDDLRKATRQLSAVHNGLQSPQTLADADALLAKLTALAADVEQIYSETSFRFSASLAYQDIVTGRLEALNTERLDGFQSLRGFLQKRMMPAMQSVTAFAHRLDKVSSRIARAGQLQRSQTEMALQRQNRDLLTSMNKRTQAQLRLQQTVEGLSIAALTYYGVGLVGYVASALPLPISTTIVKALAVPIIALTVYGVMKHVRRTLARQPDQD